MTAAERREQLLDVTTEIVAERGFQGVSIQSVARTAGISRPIVYEHFGDLTGLLEALVERETARALAQVSETTVENLTETSPKATRSSCCSRACVATWTPSSTIQRRGGWC
jgi:AcrR family transcriptional regulator